MKTCKDCGNVNKDTSTFCAECGSANLEYTPSPENIQPPPPPPVQPAGAAMPPPPPVAPPPVAPPPQPVRYQPMYAPKPVFTKFELFAIFGFVSSLVGLFEISLILEPLALVTAILGFAKGKRYRGLAAAGIVIAGIGLLIRLFTTLYQNGLIPQWLISGAYN